MKNNNISYRRVGDYNIPNLTLPPEEANITLKANCISTVPKNLFIITKALSVATITALG